MSVVGGDRDFKLSS